MITPDNPYFPQVELLVGVLPYIADVPVFALKGGTAINLFVRDLPRLSVDIDLTFLPVTDRETALREIDAALGQIRASLEGDSPGYEVRSGKREAGRMRSMLVTDGVAEIKIEVSPVLRGSVYPETTRRIGARAEAQFGFAEIPTLSFEDLYAGKIVAALDRQHPRDLFDVKLLLETEGISDALFRAFLVYLISHDGSLARVIHPAPKPIGDLFENQFKYMSAEPVTLEELDRARGPDRCAARQNRQCRKDVPAILQARRAAVGTPRGRTRARAARGALEAAESRPHDGGEAQRGHCQPRARARTHLREQGDRRECEGFVRRVRAPASKFQLARHKSNAGCLHAASAFDFDRMGLLWFGVGSSSARRKPICAKEHA